MTLPDNPGAILTNAGKLIEIDDIVAEGGGGGLPDGLTWDAPPNGTLGLGGTENGTVTIQTKGIGEQVFLEASDGDADHVGGEVTITSGGSEGGDGGQINIASGGDTGGGNSGDVDISSGASTEGDGGDVTVRANPGAPAGNNGGGVIVEAGQGTNHGGNAIVSGGAPDGNVQVYSGDGNQSMQLDNTGLTVIASVGFYGGTPAAQPVVPLTSPTVQGVIDALVALGLVAQHD